MHNIQQYSLSRTSQLLLQFEAPAILLQAIVFLISYLIARESDPAHALIQYRPYIEYLLFPIPITAFSVLLIERLEMENHKR